MPIWLGPVSDFARIATEICHPTFAGGIQGVAPIRKAPETMENFVGWQLRIPWHGSCFEKEPRRWMMGVAVRRSSEVAVPVMETTLLELVRVVSELTDDDREVVATVMEMLRSGRVRLCGTFRGSKLGV